MISCNTESYVQKSEYTYIVNTEVIFACGKKQNRKTSQAKFGRLCKEITVIDWQSEIYIFCYQIEGFGIIS